MTFRLTSPLLDGTGNVIATPAEIVTRLNPQGEISVALVATNDPGTQPAGVAYTVTERIDGTRASYSEECGYQLSSDESQYYYNQPEDES